MDRLKLLDAGLRAFDARLPDVVPPLCVVTRYRASSCRRCLDVCPADAIAPVAVAAGRARPLQSCGACAAVCPTGALDFGTRAAALRERFAAAAGCGDRRITLACRFVGRDGTRRQRRPGGRRRVVSRWALRRRSDRRRSRRGCRRYAFARRLRVVFRPLCGRVRCGDRRARCRDRGRPELCLHHLLPRDARRSSSAGSDISRTLTSRPLLLHGARRAAGGSRGSSLREADRCRPARPGRAAGFSPTAAARPRQVGTGPQGAVLGPAGGASLGDTRSERALQWLWTVHALLSSPGACASRRRLVVRSLPVYWVRPVR